MSKNHPWGMYPGAGKSLLCAACAAVAVTTLAAWPTGPSGARAADPSSSEIGSSSSAAPSGWGSRPFTDWVTHADDDITFVGNRVGIGTASPSYKVDSRTLAFSVAVYGRQNASTGTTTGVYGVAASNRGRGVVGVANSNTGSTYAGLFDSHSSAGRGVEGRATASSGSTYGVSGRTSSRASGARGVIGFATAPADAVRAVGDLVATGVKAFEIDHPLDPANKWLRHYVTESPDPMNAYSGNAVLDGNGAAWVTLPDWFQAINRDFRYQLTAMGAPAPNLHVARQIEDNVFLIAGGAPGGAVSWRVEAVRNDRYVREYGAPTEIVKPAEARELYLHPELYQLTPDRGLDYAPLEPELTDDVEVVEPAGPQHLGGK